MKQIVRQVVFIASAGVGLLLQHCGGTENTVVDASVIDQAVTVPVADSAITTPDLNMPQTPAIGAVLESTADPQGNIALETPVAGGTQYVAVLLSRETTAPATHRYGVKKMEWVVPKDGTNSPAPNDVTPNLKGNDRPNQLISQPVVPAHRCIFSQQLQRIHAVAKRAKHMKSNAPKSVPYRNVHPLPPLPVKAGDKQVFQVFNYQINKLENITAESVAVDDVAIYWLDRTSQPAAAIDDTLLTQISDGFARIIMPRLRTYFGQESDINQDKHISVLFSPLVSSANAFAYVNPCDMVDPATEFACQIVGSNQQEVLYVTPPGTSGPIVNGGDMTGLFLETMAHEFQHAIYAYRKYILKGTSITDMTDESNYITEGLSHLAEDLSGYAQFNLSFTLRALERLNLISVLSFDGSLNGQQPVRPTSSDEDAAWRGSGYLLLRYLFEQAGGDQMDAVGTPIDKGGISWLNKFVDGPEMGTKNIASLMPLDKIIDQLWTAVAFSNQGPQHGPLVSQAIWNYQPITIDPLTKKERGCNLFANSLWGQLHGPKAVSIEQADGALLAGGAEFFTITVPPNATALRLSINVDGAAATKAVFRLARVF